MDGKKPWVFASMVKPWAFVAMVSPKPNDNDDGITVRRWIEFESFLP